jgi:hypothetical protein
VFKVEHLVKPLFSFGVQDRADFCRARVPAAPSPGNLTIGAFHAGFTPNSATPSLTAADSSPIYVNVNNIYIVRMTEEKVHKVAEWLGQAERWLDDKGKGAWIATMVLAFIFAWPIGLAILIYMIWSGRMQCGKHSWRRHHRTADAATGNSAFDEYREETLRRLEEEQTAFHSFMERLRKAKDKAEFDQFMAERGRTVDDGPVSA